VPSGLRLLLVSDHGYLPDRTGGKEVSTHELAARYSRDGHDVSVLVSDQIPGYRLRSIAGSARYAKSCVLRRLSERGLPYRVHRSRNVQQTLRELIERQHFDLTILQFDVPHKNLAFDLPRTSRYVIYLRDAREVHTMSPTSFPRNFALVANSNFTASVVAKQTRRAVTKIVPYVEKSRYVTSAQGGLVTFVNPVDVKGVELAFRIAEACPELPFQFVESWPLSKSARSELISRIRRVPNIRYRRSVSDMRSVYRETRVLLMPSQWEESWGRVVTESHFSAIPVLASEIGGLPESVGCGGILLPPTDHEKNWVEALRALYAPTNHSRVSALAREQGDIYWAKAQSLPNALLACAPEARQLHAEGFDQDKA
jgi:glycosyltransferase involved in cell wall biosynthesis